MIGGELDWAGVEGGEKGFGECCFGHGDDDADGVEVGGGGVDDEECVGGRGFGRCGCESL